MLGSVYIATWTRYVDMALREVMGEEYIRTARAKGAAPGRLVWRHALPNAAIPLVTVLGMQLGHILSGAVVTEVVFSWPGFGSLLTQSLLGRDYPVAMAVMMLLAVSVVVANVVTDLVYGVLDPRVRSV